MKKKYEDACREAGLSEKEIREIRKVFDSDRKALKREHKYQKRYGVEFRSLSASDDSGEELDIEDPDMDVEEIALHNIRLEKLRVFLEELQEEDREFILDCFESSRVQTERICNKYGITARQIFYRRQLIMTMLRKSFEQDIKTPD